jgi:hypothetical protein
MEDLPRYKVGDIVLGDSSLVGNVLTIDRRVWFRGGVGSRLLRAVDGKMCCLGIACAVQPELARYTALEGRSAPSGVANELDFQEKPFPELLAQMVYKYKREGTDYIWTCTPDMNGAMIINDDSNIGDEEREYQLIKIFRNKIRLNDQPVELRFVN